MPRIPALEHAGMLGQLGSVEIEARPSFVALYLSAPVPEPSTLLLLGTGSSIGLLGYIWRRRLRLGQAV